MPLTNSAWGKNFRLQAATTGGNPVPKGDRGSHIAILRQNLEAVGFERTLEPIDFYGASTAGMIRDFRQIYNVPGNSELVDKQVLETIDAILNGKFRNGSSAPARPPISAPRERTSPSDISQPRRNGLKMP